MYVFVLWPSWVCHRALGLISGHERCGGMQCLLLQCRSEPSWERAVLCRGDTFPVRPAFALNMVDVRFSETCVSTCVADCAVATHKTDSMRDVSLRVGSEVASRWLVMFCGLNASELCYFTCHRV